ncbi:MAG: hypothetical protein EXR77_02385 [Myxococcales bacterium]|nr:hypothetical protein [Myxococcales bacterium]
MAKCAYEVYQSKPYWQPIKVDTEDLCGTTLGAQWRLLAESDLALWQPEAFTLIHEAIAPSTLLWGSNYFSLDVYLRGTDGTLKVGKLKAGAATVPVPFKDDGSGSLEGKWSVRCVRILPVIPVK